MEKKRRVHFDEFMLDIHDRVHKLRLRRNSKENFDSVPMVADTILEQSWLLCFDEFQVCTLRLPISVSRVDVTRRMFTV